MKAQNVLIAYVLSLAIVFLALSAISGCADSRVSDSRASIRPVANAKAIRHGRSVRVVCQ